MIKTKKKIIKPVDIFGFEQREIKTYPKNILEQQVGSDLRKIGFKIDYVKQAPFDVFAKEKALVVSDVEDNRKRLKERALHLKEFIQTAGKSAIVITDTSNESDIEGIPVIKRKELREMKSKDIIKLAKKSR